MTNPPLSSVYGPVESWRVGSSLGIDLICATSTCSFNCIYCQLGSIQDKTNQRSLFIPTTQVMQDFEASRWREADIVTFSGSGEPTLATNLGEVSLAIKAITPIPQLLLTNGTLLDDPEVIEDCQTIDRVYVKLDAPDEVLFQRINRPVDGITLQRVLHNIETFRRHYKGYFGIQTMLAPTWAFDVEAYAALLLAIQPDEVQLNTPKRPYPKYWHISSRGGHNEELRQYESVPLRTISREEAEEIEQQLIARTRLNIVSVYH